MFDLADLTLEEKVGQLFIAPFSPDRGEDHSIDWDRLLTECHVGGLLVKQGTVAQVATGISALQAKTLVSLLVTADAEWGLGMRISDAPSYPKAHTLAATHPDAIRALARQVALQGQLLGIHVHLGPVADLTTAATVPSLAARSFGSDPAEVALRVAAYAEGIESTGALACLKHFPGHGDTALDSHYALPLLPHSRAHLEACEWIPFHVPASALMTAHLLVPALDPSLPTTLSPATGPLLRLEWHFDGLLITDALNMGALQAYTPEEIALLAYEAGHDLLLYGAHLIPAVDALTRDTIPRAYRALLSAFQTGALPLSELDRRVARILRAKARAHWLPSKDPDLALRLLDMRDP